MSVGQARLYWDTALVLIPVPLFVLCFLVFNELIPITTIYREKSDELLCLVHGCEYRFEPVLVCPPNQNVSADSEFWQNISELRLKKKKKEEKKHIGKILD